MLSFGLKPASYTTPALFQLADEQVNSMLLWECQHIFSAKSNMNSDNLEAMLARLTVFRIVAHVFRGSCNVHSQVCTCLPGMG